MKWGQLYVKTQAILNIVVIIVLIFALMSIIVGKDYLTWRDAVSLIKQNIPTGAEVILQKGNGGVIEHYTPFRWQGELRGRIVLGSDEDFNLKDIDGHAGMIDGAIKNFSGITAMLDWSYFPNTQWKVAHVKTTLKNITGSQPFEAWVFLLDKGEKVYRKVFDGYKAVDYPITKSIIRRYRRQIDIDSSHPLTDKDIEWLCTFTHDTLHQYVLSFFENNKVPELFVGRNIFAYRLDQIISSQVHFIATYKKVWTKERKGACIGIIYDWKGERYVRVVYNAWYLPCKGGGFVFDFWH